MYKAYSNPLYDEVDNEADWTNGLCAIFGNALVERFKLPLKALMVTSDDGTQTMVHTVGSLPGGLIVDANGVRPEADLLAVDYGEWTDVDWRGVHCAKPNETITVALEDTTVEQLWSLSPEDLDATNAAHAFIDANPERFATLFEITGVPMPQGPTEGEAPRRASKAWRP